MIHVMGSAFVTLKHFKAGCLRLQKKKKIHRKENIICRRSIGGCWHGAFRASATPLPVWASHSFKAHGLDRLPWQQMHLALSTVESYAVGKAGKDHA